MTTERHTRELPADLITPVGAYLRLREALCGPAPVCTGVPFSQGMLPAVSLLVDRGALQDLFTLVTDVLEGCK